MSTIDHEAVAQRLTLDRLSSYRAAAHDNLANAIALYDWNAEIASALHEDIGRLEVTFRNTIDRALVAHGEAAGWPHVWYRRTQLFRGKAGARALADIETARRRSSSNGATERHGKVIAELSLGFWRYLCAPRYLTSLWIPALADAFPQHPERGNPRVVRQEVEDRIQRVHYLRNRVAHHEPIHRRDIQQDSRSIRELAGWICASTQAWIAGSSRVNAILDRRPKL